MSDKECICGKPVSVCEAPIPKGEFDRQKAIDAITVPSKAEWENLSHAAQEKTYRVTITYETEITTDLSAEDIENSLWTGDCEIGRFNNEKDGRIHADAVDYEVEVME